MDPMIKFNVYFQTAILDPVKRKPYNRLPDTILKPTKITIGNDTSTQRTWTLSPTLLLRCPELASLARKTPNSPLHIPDADPQDFATYMMYLHSSIYSLNPEIPDFRALRAGTRAHLLGLRLRDVVYADTAIRQVHGMFTRLARLRTSNANKSIIRASDIEFVCERAVKRSGIRRLFMDAVSSHWAQDECLNYNIVENRYRGVTWGEVVGRYRDLEGCLFSTRTISNRWRGCLLGAVEDYLSGCEEERKRVETWDGEGLHPNLVGSRVQSLEDENDVEQTAIDWSVFEKMDIEAVDF